MTFNHTVGTGANRYLIVSVAIERADATVASVTYAGQALTFLGRITDANVRATLDVWGRIAPNTGTNQVVVTLNGAAAVVVGAISFGGVDQASPIAASHFASGTSGLTASASVASATNQLILAVIAANDSVNSVTAGAGQTSRWNVLNFADVIGAGSTRPGSATSTTMSYSLASQGGWGMGLFALHPANPLIVTSTSNSGSGSLREAVSAANANPGPDTISFNIAGSGPHTITLSSPLPAFIGAGDTIDGSTQPGASCGDLWAGTPPTLLIHLTAGAIGTGLHLEAANLTVTGLAITGFTNKVYIHPGASNVTIKCNYIGLLPNGTRGSGNSPGVSVDGHGTVIGGLNPGEGNVISGNTFAVQTYNGTTNTAVRGNFIGTNPAGMAAIANTWGINHLNGSGTWRDITGNLVSGNTSGAIVLESNDQISPSTDLVRIQDNIIGFTRDLSALLRNGGNGISFPTSSISGVLIGGTASTEGNVITASSSAISLQSVSSISIRGNVIARAVARGILIDNASAITIGGNAATEGNSIGGNGTDGIYIHNNASNITILGNLIQPITITGASFANAGEGIWIDGASTVSVGNGTAQGRNVIGGNGLRAIRVGSTNSNITIDGNYIGTDASGNAAVTNGQNAAANARDAIGVQFATVTNLSIRNNVIGGYTASLVEAFGGSSASMTIQNNSLGIGVDGVSQIAPNTIEDLLFIGGSGNHTDMLIGGSGAGQGNVVAFGGRDGIRLDMNSGNVQVIGNTIRNNAGDGVRLVGSSRAAIIGNRIFANGLRGIDLGGNGVTPNDAGDGDSGINDLLNFPVINSIGANGTADFIYNFNLDAPASTNGYRIEFFRNSAADPSGNGEGEVYLGSINVDHAGGNLNFNGAFTASASVSVSDIISATATRNTGSGFDITSEFSDNVVASARGALTVAIGSEVYDPGAAGLFSVPQNDRLSTATVTNEVGASTTNDSIVLIIDVPADTEFYNGDVDDAGPETNPIAFDGTDAPGLTFTYAADVRYSDAGTRPDFASCTYTPSAGYDPNVRFICINPKGSMPQGDPPPSFVVQFRQRIR